MSEEHTTAELVEELRSDQRRRWQAGDRVGAETYLQQHPTLQADPDCALELVYCEVMLREQQGESPQVAEYLQRFPQLAGGLTPLFELHRALESDQFSNGSQAKTWKSEGTQEIRTKGAEFPNIPGYEILGELGRGGMGIVYRAWQTGLNRSAAVKMILAGSFASAHELARFRTEAEAIGRLQHANIVSIYQVGEQDGRPYLAMEYVDGGSLAQKLAGTPLPSRQSAELVESLALAMHYAHQRGILHRDLTPANVMMTAEGLPKITDFGLAKVLAEGAGGQTKSGTIAGTPSYMAPEQTGASPDGERSEGGRLIGPAVDVYALGAILYHMITGRPPFRAETPVETLLQVVEVEPVPPSRLQPKLPRDLVTICLKCLSKRPSNRYPSTLALAVDLRRFLDGRPIEARPVGQTERVWRWCRRKPAVAGLSVTVAISLVTIAIGSLAAAYRLDKSRNQARIAERVAQVAALDALRAEAKTKNKLWDSLLAQAEADRRSDQAERRYKSLKALAEAAKIPRDLRERELRLRNEAIACMALVDLRPIEQWNAEGPSERFTAFDAKLERYACNNGRGSCSIRRVDDHKEILCLPEPGPAWYDRPEFSPDGRYLAIGYLDASGTRCVVWDLSQPKEILRVPLAQAQLAGSCFCFSPDSRRIVIGLPDSRRSVGQPEDQLLPMVRLALFDLAEHKEIKSLGEGLQPENIVFHPNGELLAVTSRRDQVQIVDVVTAKIVPLPIRAGTAGLAWSSDGRLLAASCSDTRIYVWNMVDRRLQSVLEGHQSLAVHLTFNHAGDMLASHGWDNTTRLWDPISGRQLVTAQGTGTRFSPDDQRLAFMINSSDGAQIGFWQVAEGKECRTLHHGDFGNRVPWPGYQAVRSIDFNSNGGLLASASGDGIRLWDPATGRHLAHLSAPDTSTARFRPGGAHLLTHGRNGLSLWPIAGVLDRPGAALEVGPPKPLELPGGLEWNVACWSRSGRYLAALDPKNNQILFQSLEKAEEKALYQCAPKTMSLALSMDGRWFASGGWKAQDVKVREVNNGRLVRALPTVKTTTGSAMVAFSPDRKWLVTGGQADFRFWHIDSWEPGPVIPRDQELPIAGNLAFTKDGRILAIAWSAQTIKLIDTATGDEIAALSAPDPQAITGLCFSPDGGQLAASTDNHVIQLWDLRLIRRQLASMGLDWESSDSPSPPDANRKYYTKVVVAPSPPKDFKEELRLASEKQQRDMLQTEKNISAYTEALKKTPNFVEAYSRRALIYLRLEQYEKAIADLKSALDIDPQHAGACNDLAWIYVTCPPNLRNLQKALVRNPQKALELAERAVRIAPDESNYRNTLGVALFRLDRFDAAVDSFQQAVQRNYGEATAQDLFFLAMSYHHLGDAAQARDSYDRALRWWQFQSDLSLAKVKQLHAFQEEADALLGIRSKQ